MRRYRRNQRNRGEGLLQEEQELDFPRLDEETWKSGNPVVVAERDQGVLEEEIEAATEEHDALAMMEERAGNT